MKWMERLIFDEKVNTKVCKIGLCIIGAVMLIELILNLCC